MWRASIHPKAAGEDPAFVSQRRRLTSSSWHVPDELSAITLSSASPTAHIEPRIPAVRGLLANVHDAS
jgi:hypothetical protein